MNEVEGSDANRLQPAKYELPTHDLVVKKYKFRNLAKNVISSQNRKFSICESKNSLHFQTSTYVANSLEDNKFDKYILYDN